MTKPNLLLSVTLLMFVMAACGAGAEQDAAQTDGASTPAERSAAEEGTPREGSPMPAPAAAASQQLGLHPSLIDCVNAFAGRDVQEVGLWWAIPQSSLVLRGVVDAQRASEPIFSGEIEMWSISVIDGLLGDAAAGDLLTVGHRGEDNPFNICDFGAWQSWHPGQEAIFFLAENPSAPGQFYLVWGDVTVIRDDLALFSSLIPHGADLLGRIVEDRRPLTTLEWEELRELATEYGRLPLPAPVAWPEDRLAISEEEYQQQRAEEARKLEQLAKEQAEEQRRLEEALYEAQTALVTQPFVIDRGEVRIVFDQWFFMTLDPAATVTVTIEGEVVAQGPVRDPAVVADDAGTLSFLGANGDVVATLTQSELNAEIDLAWLDAGFSD